MSKLDAALKQLGEFIRAIREDVATQGTHAEASKSESESLTATLPAFVFSLKDYGSLTLDGEDAEQFRLLLDEVISTVGDKVSKKFVEGHIKEYVLRSLDINGVSSVPFDQRLKDNLRALKSDLFKPARKWLVYLRVRGLGPEGLPTAVGNATFCIMDGPRLASLHETLSTTVDGTTNSDNEKATLKQRSKDDLERRLLDQGVAIIEVHAVESEAAITLALRELRSTLDAVNFYSDLLAQPGLRCEVRLPTEGQTVNELIPVHTQEGGPFFSLDYRVIGPLQDLPASVLVSPRATDLGFPKVSLLLANPNRNELEDALVAALQLAGRATVEERREVAFLLYMIAIESLAAPTQAPEITYRLSRRIAVLLGDNLTRRKRIREMVAKLYSKRSSIAHSGYTEVSDVDLALARYLAKSAVLRVLLDEPFVAMQKTAQLESWFEDQLLA